MLPETDARIQEYFTGIFESSEKGIIFIDPQGRFESVNPAFIRMLGYPDHELKGKPFSEILYASQNIRRLTSYNRLHYFIRAEKTPVEIMVLLKDGRNLPARLASVLIRDDKGGVARAIGIIDVADRQEDGKALEHKIWQTQHDLRSVLDNSGDAILIVDVSGIITTANAPLLQMLRYEEHELIGRHLIELSPFDGTYTTSSGEKIVIDDEYKDRNVAKATELFEKGRVADYELYLMRSDKVIIPVDATLSILRDKEGRQRGSIAICRNLTERKIAERRLKTAMKKIQAANEAKTRLLANVSHELRTPLNAIIGFCELLMATESREKLNTYAGLIMSESEVLLNIINDLLDISRVESGKLALESLPFDLERLLDSISVFMELQAREKGLRLGVSIGENVPKRLKGDPKRIRQVISNLVSNAVKFTDKGSIDIMVRLAEEFPEKVRLLVQVKDTGIGIPKDRQRDIFDAFVQADGSATRKHGGTGLGTAIARQLVALMGGEIGLESEPGKGSTFWFTAVLDKRYPDSAEKTAPCEPPVVAQAEELCGRGSILLAEDYKTNQEIVVMHLEAAGYSVAVAGDGLAALAMSRSQKFDLILMDVQMPEMDGHEATRLIRKEENPNRTTPIIALTANAHEKDREACLKAGMNGFVIKPFRKKALLETVQEWTEGGPGPEAAKAPVETDDTPIDYRQALDEFGGNEALLDRVISEFLERINLQIELMRAALREGSAESLRREAHAIKGGAANLVANPLSRAAKLLEAAGASGNAAACGSALDALEIEYKRLKAHIELRPR